jgi:DNA-binding transcriptional MerR regulator
LLTLPEFAEAAARAVQSSGAVPDNRQAKAVPAARMIRYYTARGLLPRPGTRGRALVYGRRHLLQLVAIKRLQGRGMGLDEIGERLFGISDADLERLAAVADGAMPANLGEVDPTQLQETSRTAGRFWEAPLAVTAPGAAGRATAPGAAGRAAAPGAAGRATAKTATPTAKSAGGAAAVSAEVSAAPVVIATAVSEIRLSDSVRLLVEGDRSRLPSLEALRGAADPLLQLLAPNPAAAHRKERS